MDGVYHEPGARALSSQEQGGNAMFGLINNKRMMQNWNNRGINQRNVSVNLYNVMILGALRLVLSCQKCLNTVSWIGLRIIL